MDNHGRTVTGERGFITCPVDCAHGQEVRRDDARRNRFVKCGIRITVTGRGDEENLRRAGKHLRQSFFLDFKQLSGQGFSSLRSPPEAAFLKTVFHALDIPTPTHIHHANFIFPEKIQILGIRSCRPL